MDYLKRFVSFNILSIIGYWVLGLCIYNFIIIVHFIISKLPFPGMALVLGALMVITYYIIFLLYFLPVFLCEFLISFILSKIFRKQISLNFKNKVYDLLFRFGIFCCFIPITIISSFSLWMMLGAIFGLFLGTIFKYGDSWISLIILCLCMFDIEIKDIFFKKYFVHHKNK